MRFSEAQYQKAIDDINDARGQLAPDGRCCRICHDTGHQAWECGSNPLLAELVCNGIAERAEKLHEEMHRLKESGAIGNADAGADGAMFDKLHEFLHYLAGYDSHMGQGIGPANVRERTGK